MNDQRRESEGSVQEGDPYYSVIVQTETMNNELSSVRGNGSDSQRNTSEPENAEIHSQDDLEVNANEAYVNYI